MKKKYTTKKQVVETLIDFLIGSENRPKLLRKVDGVAGNDHSFTIDFYEGDNFYTEIKVIVGEPKLYEVEE